MLRRFRRWPSRGWIALGLLLIAVVVRFLTSEGDARAKLLIEGDAQVVRVVDGRTLQIRQSSVHPQRVRLIGVRLDHRRVQAHDWLTQATSKRTIEIAFDKRRLELDGTWLVYAYLDEMLLNEELLRQGLAAYEPYPGDSATIAKVLREAELAAQEK